MTTKILASFFFLGSLLAFRAVNTQTDEVCPLPTASNELFQASGNCVDCHGFDTLGIASVDLKGIDVNVVDDWRASMMANSAKDPFWRAKVSHEVLLNPGLQNEIEDKCTACHAPLGNFNAHHIGQGFYSIEELLTDSVGADGVSCLACHQQATELLGLQFSGHLNFDTAQVAYGPYENPLISPMAEATGYVPTYSEHIQDAGICAGCHTLITETVDSDGNFTGDQFVEQATYHEWLNSSYSSPEGERCQDCHMPSLGNTPVQIAAGYDTPPRLPFLLHSFAGANTLMLKLMKANKDSLGIAATDEQFDQAIQATNSTLQFQSADVEASMLDRSYDTAFYSVVIENHVGHKFPSGYPARRLSVEFVVTDEVGNVVFESGSFDEEYAFPDEDDQFEPHYDVIRNESEVQIYEMVMGDINEEFTTVLDRAYIPLKDNRLVPEGFSLSHPSYDTTALAGAVLDDSNFNNDGIVGSGTDELFFHIPTNGYEGPLTAHVKLWYQSLPSSWMEEIFGESTPEIEAFETMYYAADRSPVLIDQDEVSDEGWVGMESSEQSELAIWSNSLSREVFVRSPQEGTLNIYSVGGQLIDRQRIKRGVNRFQLERGGLMVVEALLSNDHRESSVIVL